MEGAAKPILNLCGMKETIALLAITTLSLIVDHEDNLYGLIEVSIFCIFICIQVFSLLF